MTTISFPQITYDIDQTFGNDLILTESSGGGASDLSIVAGLVRSEQRVVRRLMTVPLDYIWQTTYGAGLPAFVGEPLSTDFFNRLKALITSQIFLEPSVSRDPTPVINFQPIQDGIFCQIDYTENPSRQPIILNFNITQ